ncbi:ImmA/IrrE family metallo-endopeptidase [Alteribacillus sp. JSM 102045]|uniref:ImmA/IrrE family metallo-endopeptidase n=1 Tax=Alteribacillus sp. JSM 102045 TaxID=1562101 RepID=UPI0035C1BF6C
MFHSNLEAWIVNEYDIRGIHTIDDLSIENLCLQFNIDLEFTDSESKCIWDDGYQLILLKQDQPLENQRWDFFHELGHIMRHVGNQRAMPLLMIEYVEAQARQFSMYASMPFPIIKPYLTSSYNSQEIAELFTLPVSIVEDRLAMILRQLNSGRGKPS